jgi:tetratricopeptide (TPR) repeat protein
MKKLLLYAIISGSRRHIDRLLRDQPTLFSTIEDFLWFKLSAVRDCPSGSSSIVLSDGLIPYSLDDLQSYLNKFEPSYYTKNGKDPLVYPYILLLSIQLLPAVLYLSKETGDEGYNIDAAHLSIVLADHGVLSEGAGTGQKLGVMDAYAEVSTIIRQYGSMYLRLGDLQMALEYYAQAAAAVGGGQLSWTGRGNVDQQRQRNLMLKQLLTELLLRDGGIYLLLGARGAGEEGELGRFVADPNARQQFLIEAGCQCQEAGMYDKVISFLCRSFILDEQQERKKTVNCELQHYLAHIVLHLLKQKEALSFIPLSWHLYKYKNYFTQFFRPLFWPLRHPFLVKLNMFLTPSRSFVNTYFQFLIPFYFDYISLFLTSCLSLDFS